MKANNIEYTDSEINQLCVSLISNWGVEASELRTRVYNVRSFYDSNKPSNEVRIHSIPVESKWYIEHEPYGESRYFVVTYWDTSYQLEIYSRHIRKFLYIALLKEMPLLINTPLIKDLATWRLKIGK